MKYDWKKIIMGGCPDASHEEKNWELDPAEEKKREEQRKNAPDTTGLYLDKLNREHELKLLQVHTPEEVAKIVGKDVKELPQSKKAPVYCVCGRDLYLKQDPMDHCWYGKCECGREFFLSSQELKLIKMKGNKLSTS